MKKFIFIYLIPKQKLSWLISFLNSYKKNVIIKRISYKDFLERTNNKKIYKINLILKVKNFNYIFYFSL